ncbi:DUF6090 family protein [Lacinutrix jangbogonensis]|uniref:DUF6090 family protein n=1 Tax=Lacinutrix jangbogonensis TaxID=1469557 RepID=UPI00068AF64A|nr:DUF6090 family protein [Lacinutrix jangbogonensis]
MIKFFRHIRKSLLLENKTGKYFKYAIGEIVLVVIGILFALQINDWSNTNKEKAVLENYFVKIHAEITITQRRAKWFSAKLDTLNQHNNRSLDIINLKNKDSLYLLKETLGALGTAYRANFSYPIINEFLNEGYLSKVKNDSLKNGLQMFSILFEDLNSSDDYVFNQYTTAIEPYFYNTINYANVVHGGAHASGLKTVGPTTNYNQFYNNLKLWNLLTFKIESTVSLKWQVDRLYRTLETVDKILENEIKDKD